LNGQYHRVDGPAIEWASGEKYWYLNGQPHREDGPAVECANGYKSWYLNGEKLTEEEFKLKMNAKEYPKKEVASEGIFWRNEKGEYHREDGPAIEWSSGAKEWWLNGKLHRKDGPAVEYANGDKNWFLNGQRHRANGPACEWVDGRKEWYLNGKRLSEEQYLLTIEPPKAKQYAVIELNFPGVDASAAHEVIVNGIRFRKLGAL
jgi:hypothetical protein